MPRTHPHQPQDGLAAARGWPASMGMAGVAAVLGVAMLVATATDCVHAAPSAQAAQAGQRSVSIAAGPLTHVIAQYANQAGVALSFDAAQLGRLQSPGLQGRYGVEDGFARLLQGTALQAVRESSGVYTLRPLPAAASGTGGQTLGTVTVRATAPASATTETSDSYAASLVTGYKGLQSVRDIPQPVTVLTRQWLDEQALPDLHAVLQHTPGVTVEYIDSERIAYYSRGYQIDSLQVDGLNVNQVASASTFIQPDMAMLDRVEVLRGATGLLRGAGSPSAMVNMVRKRPTAQWQGSAALTLGSWDRQRMEADLSGPLNAAGTLRGRLVALADDKASFQTARKEKRLGLYGVLEADLGPRTTLTAGLQHTDLQATGSWGGLPAAADGSQLGLPRSTYLGTPWNTWDRHNQQAFAELEHRLDSGWQLKAQAAHTRFRSDGFKQTSFSRASDSNPYLFDVSTSIYGGDGSTQNALSLLASGPFEALGRRHELSLGADLQRIRSTGATGYWGVSPLRNVDIRGWNPYTSYPEPFYSEGNGNAYSSPVSHIHQYGGFARARLSLTDSLTAIAGARLSWWSYLEPGNAQSGYSVRRELTPYAGLVHALSDTLDAYASYSEIFSPQDKKAADGSILAPARGEDLEAGLKGSFMDGRLQASVSVFRIQRVGSAMQDTASAMPCLPYYPTSHCFMAGGKSRSQGWELELSGEPAPGWQVLAGYTYTQARYLRDASEANVGQPLRPVDPRHALRLFASHRFKGPLQGWTAGAGVRLQSDAYASVGDVTTRQGGYALFDALLAYRLDDTYSLQLNVSNLLDKRYYAKFSPNSTYFNNYYGDPRNVTVSLRARF
ncbi:TonB-dependent siderophore receptor [Delftia sp. RIT313]|uniref:TonB-dependent siderophore receptor n=1 Tax=Delftia sp. RIT313 TaxID=1468410 RepID=UPI000448A66F|nr:TonB-dependent siderophore receptor [Delftia sp. RIT313]EZP47995.1 Iron complex outermembrane recepter protein [Delftia sp. RIT313]